MTVKIYARELATETPTDDNVIPFAPRRDIIRIDHNEMILMRIHGVPAQEGTPETDADPLNPNLIMQGHDEPKG